jgi:hypothetical protein
MIAVLPHNQNKKMVLNSASIQLERDLAAEIGAQHAEIVHQSQSRSRERDLSVLKNVGIFHHCSSNTNVLLKP